MSEPVVSAERLYRFFHVGDDETTALTGVSVTVGAGEVVAITGPSGSGKSTLLSCLAGIDDPDAGRVTICGERISRRPEAVRARMRTRRIGMLFQHDNLVAHLSIVGNLGLARRLAGGRAPAGWADELLDLCGLSGRAAHRAAQLSGGELARAGLAVAIANDPAVILADEPTGELDSATADRILALLRARADAGSAVVIVTHNPDVSDRADRTLELLDGQVRA